MRSITILGSYLLFFLPLSKSNMIWHTYNCSTSFEKVEDKRMACKKTDQALRSSMFCLWVSEWDWLLNGDTKSYILLQTAAISFLSNLYLKQGIGSVNVMVDFIFNGYLLTGTQAERELQYEKILAHRGIRTRDLLLTKQRRFHWATRTDVCRLDKSSSGFNCAIFRNLPAAQSW